MNFDPRFTELRDRCRRLAMSIKRGQAPTATDIAQIAEDLATVSDELNTLLNRLENRPSDRKEPPFKGF